METTQETIDLGELFNVLKKRFWMIFVITLIATVTSGVVSFFFITPQYQAKTDLLVNKGNNTNQGNITQQEINANLGLIETYNGIMKTPRILNLVAEKLNMKGKEKTLAGQIKVSSVKNSQIISISVMDINQGKAVLIANTLAETFKEEIVKIMNVDNVQILAEAMEDPAAAPVKPNKTLNVAIAFVVGLMASVGLAFLLEFLDKTIKTEQDVERKLGLPVLGMITEIKEKDLKKEPSSSRIFSQVAAAKEGK